MWVMLHYGTKKETVKLRGSRIVDFVAVPKNGHNKLHSFVTWEIPAGVLIQKTVRELAEADATLKGIYVYADGEYQAGWTREEKANG